MYNSEVKRKPWKEAGGFVPACVFVYADKQQILPYMRMEEAIYYPSQQQLIIYYTNKMLTIEGRNLGELVRPLSMHKVESISVNAQEDYPLEADWLAFIYSMRMDVLR